MPPTDHSGGDVVSLRREWILARRHQISRRPRRRSPSPSQQVRQGRVDENASNPGPTSIAQPPAPCRPRRIILGATYQVTSRRDHRQRRPKYCADREDARHCFKIANFSQWRNLPQSSSPGLPFPVAPDGSFRGRRRTSSVKRGTRRGIRCIHPRDASSDAAKKGSSSAATNK